MTVQAGDIGFARTTGVMGWLIRVGTWLRLRKARFNHMFAVDDQVDTDGTPFVIQATMRGVINTARLDEVAPGGTIVTMTPPSVVDRARFLEFLHAQVGQEYGFITDVAMALDIVTWNWIPSFRGARKPSWQCAALVCEGMRFGGWLHDWVDIYSILPDEGYDAVVAL